jgi:hypothetical protein
MAIVSWDIFAPEKYLVGVIGAFRGGSNTKNIGNNFIMMFSRKSGFALIKSTFLVLIRSKTNMHW